MREFNVYWRKLVAALEVCLDEYEPQAFTVQTKSKLFEFGPYVQAQYLDDEIEIEITSNQFLRPHISDFYIQRMEFLGWNLPDENDHPNFWLSIPNTPEAKKWAAKLWVRTLIMVFHLPLSTHFEMCGVNRKVHDEVGKHLKPFGRPMCFGMLPVAKTKPAELKSRKKPTVIRPKQKATYEPPSDTPNALEPTAENFPDLFGPVVPKEKPESGNTGEVQ